MSKPRTAPLGAALLSRQFLDAAISVQSPARTAAQELAQPTSFVAFYLAGHSIELAFKAFLLGRGMSIASLRNPRTFGHNLSALLAESRTRRLGTCVKLSATEIKVVQLLNDCYSAKELEYVFNGTRRLPHYSVVIRLATKLQAGVASYCGKLAANNSFKPKPIRGSALFRR